MFGVHESMVFSHSEYSTSFYTVMIVKNTNIANPFPALNYPLHKPIIKSTNKMKRICAATLVAKSEICQWLLHWIQIR